MSTDSDSDILKITANMAMDLRKDYCYADNTCT